jgi:hypothetical protein
MEGLAAADVKERRERMREPGVGAEPEPEARVPTALCPHASEDAGRVQNLLVGKWRSP